MFEPSNVIKVHKKLQKSSPTTAPLTILAINFHLNSCHPTSTPHHRPSRFLPKSVAREKRKFSSVREMEHGAWGCCVICEIFPWLPEASKSEFPAISRPASELTTRWKCFSVGLSASPSLYFCLLLMEVSFPKFSSTREGKSYRIAIRWKFSNFNFS